jgi:hypothetical protein
MKSLGWKRYQRWPNILGCSTHLQILILRFKCNILIELYEFKVLGKEIKLSDLLNNVLSNSNRFPVLVKLLSIISVLLVSTASCERGFSEINLIKNKLCQHLEQTV